MGKNAAGGGLIRTIIGYAPANFIPAFGTIATIMVFTRLLPPREFGYYAVAQACHAFCSAVIFGSLQLTVIRFSRAGLPDEAGWVSTAYRSYLLCSMLTAFVFTGGIELFAQDQKLRDILWVCLLAVVLRGAVTVNVAIHRRRHHTLRYNVIECLQPVVAFFVALGLAFGAGMGAIALLWGMVASTLVALAVDTALLRRITAPSDWRLLVEMGRYGAPLSATYALSSLSAYADRAFLLGFLGTAPVGLYGIGYNLVDRATSLIFISINIGAFPMALAALDTGGPEAARRRMAHIGRVLLGLGVPAAAGLACCAVTAAFVLVGKQYRAEVAYIIPWLCLASLLRGLSVQFFEYAFHLGKKTNFALFALVPVAFINLCLNATLIPVYGIAGALIAGIATQFVGLVLNASIGGRVFRLDFPWLYAIRVVVAVIPMCAVLLLLPAYHSAIGLVFKIVVGGMAYLLTGSLLGLFRKDPLETAVKMA